jgi:hypothetical protein
MFYGFIGCASYGFVLDESSAGTGRLHVPPVSIAFVQEDRKTGVTLEGQGLAPSMINAWLAATRKLAA